MQVICTECGQPFDDDQCCYVCVARDEAIEVTFRLAGSVGIFGLIFGIFFVGDMYSLIGNHLQIFMVPGISLVLASALAFFLQDQLTRYYIGTILVIVLVAATFLVPPAYYFLNGLLDANPATEVTTQVLGKGVSAGRGGGPFVVLNFLFNHQSINVNMRVGTRTFNAVEPGDSVRLVVHPGAFSLPWHDDGCPCTASSR